MTLLAGMVIELFLLRANFARLEQLLYRDSAGFIANRILVDFSEHRTMARALNDAERAARRAIPSAQLVIATSSGEVLASSTGCGTTTSRLNQFPWAAFTSSITPAFPLLVSLPCTPEAPFLSASPFRLGKRDLVLLLFGSTGLGEFLYSWKGLALLAYHLLPAFLWLLLMLLLVLVLFRQLFLRYVNAAAHEVTRFSHGDREVRLPSTPLDDLNEIHTAFNRLADEESKRLADLSAEDEGRRRMLAELIHDLKTPLTAIEAAAERLADSTDSEQQSRYLRVINSSLEIQDQYSTMLAQLGSLPLDSFGLERLPTDLNRVLHGLIDQLRPAAETRGLRIDYVVRDASFPTLLAHEGLLQRAFQNVLSNALRYTPPGGSVTVELRDTETDQLVLIRDTGRGIPESDLPKVLEAFYRGSASSESKGSGLGLAIVDRVVRLHGGRVLVESKEGAGTTVTMRFPKVIEHELPGARVPAHEDRAVVVSAPTQPIVTAGLVVIGVFTSILVSLAFADSWISTVVAALVLLHAVYRFRQHYNPLTFLTPAPTLELLAALVVLTAVSGGWLTTVYLGFGFTLIGTFTVFSAMQRRDLILTLVGTISLLHLPWLSHASKPFMVGALGGVITIGASLVLELVLRGTRMVSLTVRSIFLLGVSSVSITAIGLFHFTPAAMRVVAGGDAERLATQIAAFASSDPSLPDLALEIAHTTSINPLFDIGLFHREKGHPVGEAIIPRVPDAGFPPAIFSEIGSDQVLKHFPSISNSRSILQVSALGDSLPELALAVQYPSWLADHLAARSFPYFMIYLSTLVWLLIGIPATLLTNYASRLVAGRVLQIREGLERYRRGNYATPIALDTDDALGTLITVVDGLAQRLPQLNAQLLNETETVKRFLIRCAQDLRLTTDTVRHQLATSGSNRDPLQLMRAASQQRQRLENLLELFNLRFVPTAKREEPIPLRELLDEEIAIAHERARVQGVPLAVNTHEVDQVKNIVGNPDICVEGLRHMLALAVDSSSAEHPTQIYVQAKQGETELLLSVPTLSLSERDLEFLEDPLHSGVGIGERALPFGGYRTVKLCRQFQALGWLIRFVPTAPSGSSIRICFHSLLLAVALWCSPVPVSALDLPLCSGYDATTQRWEMHRVSQLSPEYTCPEGSAFLALGIASRSLRDAQPPRGTCCPLPPGALLNDHSYVPDDCPEGSVMTGVRQLPTTLSSINTNVRSVRAEIRCTKIDSTRYVLVPAAAAFQINTPRDFGRAVAGDRSLITNQMRLPPELRFGLGRASRVRWEGTCVGYPWGAVLTNGRVDCDSSQFRELRSVEGEAMTSRCIAVRDIYSPSASCVLPPSER